MPVRGRPADFRDHARFLVEIDGMTYAGFQRCSEIRGTFAKKEYPDGASPIPYKKAGKEDFPDVTLERGQSENQELESWYREVQASVRGYGIPPDGYKRTVNIVEIDETGARIDTTTLFNAFPIDFKKADFDATDREGFVIESMILAYDEF